MRHVTLLALLLPITAAAQTPAEQLLALEHARSDSSAALGFAAMLDTGIIYLHPGAPIVAGRSTARNLVESLPEVAALAVEWQPQHLQLARDTSFAITWGVMTARPRAGGPSRFGRYIAAWRRDAGAWHLAALATSGVLPASAHADAHPAAIAAGSFADADTRFARLAGRRGAAFAFWSYAAEDAVTFGGGGILRRGRDAIRAALADNHDAWQWNPVISGGAADLGFTIGESAITDHDSHQTFYGKYLTAWRRERSGPRFIADIGNARPAPANR